MSQERQKFSQITYPDAKLSKSIVQKAKLGNLYDLRQLVDSSLGPNQIIAITNRGDADSVREGFADIKNTIYQADDSLELKIHEEGVRRGQLLGILDAVRQWREEGRVFSNNGVALGIVLPGKGTRLSPLTQRLHGIKPFMPMLVRHHSNGPWFNSASASLYTWSLLAYHLKRMGFCGMAWKWGDEPQIASHRLAEMNLDLSKVDAVRFGANMIVTDDLAESKEWLLQNPSSGELQLQLRRRSRTELLNSMNLADCGQPIKAMANIGSPAFSYLFLEEAEAQFGELNGWIDVDGYLFEAMTHDHDSWQSELCRDVELQKLVSKIPDFWQRVQRLKKHVSKRRGHPPIIKVIDFGEQLYWGDIGQLANVRRALWAVASPTEEGDFARSLAAIDHVKPDLFGNLIVGNSAISNDSHVRNSVLIDTTISGKANVDGAVLVRSDLGDALVRNGSVAVDCTVNDLDLGNEGLAFMSIEKELKVPSHFVHTSIPVDPTDLSLGKKSWLFDGRQDPSRGRSYFEPQYSNPDSFAKKFLQMRQRRVLPSEVERGIDGRFRGPISKVNFER